MHKSMRQDGFPHMVLRELRGHCWKVLATSRGFWWWGKCRCQSVLEERQEGGSRELQASQSQLSVPGKVMEQILWEAVSRHTKDKRVIWNRQQIFTKVKSCSTHLFFLYDAMIVSVDKGRAAGVDFRKTFDTLSLRPNGSDIDSRSGH